MPDTWRLAVAPSDRGSLLLNVIACQDAWRKLRKPSRAALLALAADSATPVHANIRRALTAHGLLDDDGLTEAGRLVVRRRPTPLPSRHVDGRRVIDVHLPEEIPA